MLTDIFAVRYEEVELWTSFNERVRRTLVQAFRIIGEQLQPEANSKPDPTGDSFWSTLNSRLSMELGLTTLSPLTFVSTQQWGGNEHRAVHSYTLKRVCENWMWNQKPDTQTWNDYINERLSFVELAFRIKGEQVAAANAGLEKAIFEARHRQFQSKHNPETSMRAGNATLNKIFADAVTELNERFRQAGMALHFHNGFIQLASDSLSTQEFIQPFWDLVANDKWANVDLDMKEAIDRRDKGDSDPAFYAARALESTIKIISDDKGWTNGTERGASNFIDNLVSKANGRFIEVWEGEALKRFFSDVRNPIGHGPGSAQKVVLTPPQESWAIESCMIWIKSLITRIT